MKICIIIANYYPEISKNLIVGADKILKKYKVKKIKKIFVPGIFEIPVTISKYINNYDGFIALGCVIRGQTKHFDLISKATINSIMRISIDSKKPIGDGILACLNKKQASIRSNPLKKNAGGQAANAVLSVLGVFKNDSK
tara:strand:- start:696 stop:1115 length:420 start_codon:yes stop_codon:yes gene_type:complete